MKKIFIVSGMFMLLTSAANAEVSLGINLGEPVYAAPTYIEPAPDYPSYHYDHHRHRHNEYWAHQHRAEPMHEVHAAHR